LNFLEDNAHHLSVLLLYTFRQQSSSSYWYSYAASGILHYCDQNGWMDEDATWYGSRPPRMPLCIRRVSSAPRKGYSTSPFLVHVYCGHGRPSQLLYVCVLVCFSLRVIIVFFWLSYLPIQLISCKSV